VKSCRAGAQGEISQGRGTAYCPKQCILDPKPSKVEGPKSATEQSHEGEANVAAGICRFPAPNFLFDNLIKGIFTATRSNSQTLICTITLENIHFWNETGKQKGATPSTKTDAVLSGCPDPSQAEVSRPPWSGWCRWDRQESINYREYLCPCGRPCLQTRPACGKSAS